MVIHSYLSLMTKHCSHGFARLHPCISLLRYTVEGTMNEYIIDPIHETYLQYSKN
jgi:hypothetical protein